MNGPLQAGVIETTDAISLVASLVSIAIAVFAIWQASTFYRWSQEAAGSAKDSARDVEASVIRIEKLYDTFYNDTFGLVKDAYSDMRKRSWAKDITGDDAAEAAERIANVRISELRREVDAELTGLVKKIEEKGDQADVAHIRQELGNLVDGAVQKSRGIEREAEGEALRPAISKRISDLRGRGQLRIKAGAFIRPLPSSFRPSVVFQELYAMRDEGLVDFEMNTVDTPLGIPSPDDPITFLWSN